MFIQKIKYFTLAVAAMLLVSCDNFLDIQPVGKVIPKTGDEYRALLTHGYKEIPENRGLATFRSDEVLMNTAVSSENDQNSYFDIWTWNDMSPSETTVFFGWRQFYRTLFVANYVLENKDNITDATTEEINQMVGESYMLRAYVHFLLVNLYGEAYTKCDPSTSKAVPLKLSSDVEEQPFRNTVGEIYASILEDIDQAAIYMQQDTWPNGYNYRFNKISVEALRARVALYMGNWELALQASERVLDQKTALSNLSEELPNHYTSVESIVALEQVMNAAYKNAGSVYVPFFKKYLSSDLRRSKYYKQQTASIVNLLKNGSNEFKCSFRTAEFYLTAAEAAAQDPSKQDLAKKYLLDLMITRYSSSGYTQKETAVLAMDQQQLLAEIYDERARELAFEGHRWFDLRRTTQPRIEKTFASKTYILEENDPRYTLRIPSDAIEANPNLTL